MKRLILISFLLFVCLSASSEIFAQRKAVSGGEVTGTFARISKAKYKGNYNEILIQALGGNKLKIEMSLTYPFQANGELSANVGNLQKDERCQTKIRRKSGVAVSRHHWSDEGYSLQTSSNFLDASEPNDSKTPWK